MSKHTSKASFFLFSVVALLIAAQVTSAATLYVSPKGSDSWSGRLAQPNSKKTDGPRASLTGARDAIRQLKSKGPLTAPVDVIISAGTYTLTGPFTLTPQDSGTKKCPITYKAAQGSQPIFTGGRVIADFHVKEEGVWQAHLPQVAEGKWYFEQLFVNGKRAVRARTPNKFYHYFGPSSELPIEGKQGQFRRTSQVRGDALKLLQNLDSSELRDVTLMAYHKWCITRRFITAIDTSANVIVTIGEKLKSYSTTLKYTRFKRQ